MTGRILSRTTVPPGLLLQPRTELTTGIVHLGLGNFHRAHQAVYTAQALAIEPGPWGILGIAPRTPDIAGALRRQEGLYTVLEISPAGRTPRIPAVHTGAVVAADDPGTVFGAIAADQTRIVTLTVTEHGYCLEPGRTTLDLGHPGVRHDLADPDRPQTMVGWVAYGLAERYRRGGAPVAVLSCDNVNANGATTRLLVDAFLEHSALTDSARIRSWLEKDVAFPNAMVDRIVPATTPELREEVRRLIDLDDAVPVPAEPFGMWVMEDCFPAGRPAWDRVGATFTDDVEAYELIKLRLLNGTHSLLAYAGALAGHATIPESRADPAIEQAARTVLTQDYLPTVRVPGGFDIDAHIEQLFERWSNTALGHRTSQVGSDGSAKLGQRVPIPALFHLDRGRLPHHLALTVAAFLSCVAPPAGFDPGPQAAAISDPARTSLAALRAAHDADPDFCRAVLDTGLLGPELPARTEFVARVADLLTMITRAGIGVALADCSRDG